MPLMSFEVENYRAFVEPAKVELKELTLLFGYNNAGKSALARVLPLLRDSSFGRRGLPFNLKSATVRGGEFEHLRSRQTGKRQIVLVLEWSEREAPRGMEEVHESLPDIQRMRLVLQDLPERRQHVIESFEITLRNSSILRGEWVASPDESLSRTLYDVRRDGGTAARATIDWLGLIPKVHRGLEADDEAVLMLMDTLCTSLQRMLWVGAVRAMQPRAPRFPRLQPNTIDPDGSGDGSGAADVLAWDKTYGGEIFASVSRWYAQHAHTPLDIVLRGDDYALVTGANQISLSDTGEGLTQVLPVLVAGAMAAQAAHDEPSYPSSYLVLEQPELHLHPAAHAPLAKFFCDIAASAKPPRTLIETHSENFLFGVQLAIARGEIDPARVLIYWVRQDDQGFSTVTPIRMDADGRPDAWPKGVFTEEAELAQQLFEARQRRSAT
jgi:hypothetical protein